MHSVPAASRSAKLKRTATLPDSLLLLLLLLLLKRGAEEAFSDERPALRFGCGSKKPPGCSFVLIAAAARLGGGAPQVLIAVFAAAPAAFSGRSERQLPPWWLAFTRT